jgi:hypothetical protein
MLLGVAAPLACGGEAAAPPAPSIAQALEFGGEQAEAAADLARVDTERRKAALAAAQAKEAAFAAGVQAAAVMPQTLPKDLASACDQATAALDEYMKGLDDTREVAQWWEGHRKRLATKKGRCLKIGSVAVAACEAAGLSAAPAEVRGAGSAGAEAILARCVELGGQAQAQAGSAGDPAPTAAPAEVDVPS